MPSFPPGTPQEVVTQIISQKWQWLVSQFLAGAAEVAREIVELLKYRLYTLGLSNWQDLSDLTDE
jgi:hypothetical protein